jgi:hypothetical protein
MHVRVCTQELDDEKYTRSKKYLKNFILAEESHESKAPAFLGPVVLKKDFTSDIARFTPTGLQPDTSTTPLPMRYASMGYTSIGFPSMGYTCTKLLNFSVLIVLL